MVVAMSCSDLHINVQDASGDLILAGEMLKRDPTNWGQWVKGVHQLGWGDENAMYDDEIEHLADIVGGRESSWKATPKYRGDASACRIYGDMKLNKVQGDFHITARGHGYREWGQQQHLGHEGSITPFTFLPSRRQYAKANPRFFEWFQHSISPT
jgi:hypothetical protein